MASANAAQPLPADHGQPFSPAKEIPVFEFTKRKRWADLLVTELNDSVILVLSEACQVWYCGNAVTELLGLHDQELVDSDLLDLMNGAFFSKQTMRSVGRTLRVWVLICRSTGCSG